MLINVITIHVRTQLKPVLGVHVDGLNIVTCIQDQLLAIHVYSYIVDTCTCTATNLCSTTCMDIVSITLMCYYGHVLHAVHVHEPLWG